MTSSVLYRDMCRLLPAGVSSPVRAFNGVGLPPMMVERGSGSRIVDVDGREFIDYCLSFGALILGHSHPCVIEPVQRRAALGPHSGFRQGWSWSWQAKSCGPIRRSTRSGSSRPAPKRR